MSATKQLTSGWDDTHAQLHRTWARGLTEIEARPEFALRRRLLGGYRRDDVHAALDELEWMNAQLTGELRLVEARIGKLEAKLQAAEAEAARLEAAEESRRVLQAALRARERELDRYRAMEQSVGAALVAACQRASEIEESARAEARARLDNVEAECARLREAAALLLKPSGPEDVGALARRNGLLRSARVALEGLIGYLDGSEYGPLRTNHNGSSGRRELEQTK
jgi:DNA repair exonuclease SbcCD ATPase subunit